MDNIPSASSRSNHRLAGAGFAAAGSKGIAWQSTRTASMKGSGGSAG